MIEKKNNDATVASALALHYDFAAASCCLVTHASCQEVFNKQEVVRS